MTLVTCPHCGCIDMIDTNSEETQYFCRSCAGELKINE